MNQMKKKSKSKTKRLLTFKTKCDKGKVIECLIF